MTRAPVARVRARTLLVLTAIVSSALGAIVVYLVLTVPNDIQAGALLKKARKQIEAGQNDDARQSLSRIVQQFPRTDAAAAATVALSSIADNERHALVAQVDDLRRRNAAQQKALDDLKSRVDGLASAPPPAAPEVQPAAPAPAPKKAPPKHTRHRRRRR